MYVQAEKIVYECYECYDDENAIYQIVNIQIIVFLLFKFSGSLYVI